MLAARHRGFTLIEAMVTVAVASVLVVLAIPSYRTFVQSNCESTQQNDFVSALHFARQEAVHRGVDITISAADDSDSSNKWGPGWDITDPDDEGIRSHEALGCSFTLNSTVSEFTYLSTGRVASAVAFTLCDGSSPGNAGRTITVEITGRVHSAGGASC